LILLDIILCEQDSKD